MSHPVISVLVRPPVAPPRGAAWAGSIAAALCLAARGIVRAVGAPGARAAAQGERRHA